MALVVEVLHFRTTSINWWLVMDRPSAVANIVADWLRALPYKAPMSAVESVVRVLRRPRIEVRHSRASDVVLMDLPRVAIGRSHIIQGARSHRSPHRLARFHHLGQLHLQDFRALSIEELLLSQCFAVLLRADVIAELVALVGIFGTEAIFTLVERLRGDVLDRIREILALSGFQGSLLRMRRNIAELSEVAVLGITGDQLRINIR